MCASAICVLLFLGCFVLLRFVCGAVLSVLFIWSSRSSVCVSDACLLLVCVLFLLACFVFGRSWCGLSVMCIGSLRPYVIGPLALFGSGVVCGVVSVAVSCVCVRAGVVVGAFFVSLRLGGFFPLLLSPCPRSGDIEVRALGLALSCLALPLVAA